MINILVVINLQTYTEINYVTLMLPLDGCDLSKIFIAKTFIGLTTVNIERDIQ